MVSWSKVPREIYSTAVLTGLDFVNIASRNQYAMKWVVQSYYVYGASLLRLVYLPLVRWNGKSDYKCNLLCNKEIWKSKVFTKALLDIFQYIAMIN
jgi:hypothetical protein